MHCGQRQPRGEWDCCAANHSAHYLPYSRAAAMSLRTMLLSIQALLASPEPDDPQDAVVAKQFKSNRNAFNITAKHWASIYANGPSRQPDCEAKVEKLMQMGFSEVIILIL